MVCEHTSVLHADRVNNIIHVQHGMTNSTYFQMKTDNFPTDKKTGDQVIGHGDISVQIKYADFSPVFTNTQY